MSDRKNIVNLIYHATVVSGLAVGYTMLSKSLLKFKAPDMGKLDFEDGAKFVGIIAASMATKDMLVKQGIVPDNIDK